MAVSGKSLPFVRVKVRVRIRSVGVGQEKWRCGFFPGDRAFDRSEFFNLKEEGGGYR